MTFRNSADHLLFPGFFRGITRKYMRVSLLFCKSVQPCIETRDGVGNVSQHWICLENSVVWWGQCKQKENSSYGSGQWADLMGPSQHIWRWWESWSGQPVLCQQGRYMRKGLGEEHPKGHLRTVQETTDYSSQDVGMKLWIGGSEAWSRQLKCQMGSFRILGAGIGPHLDSGGSSKPVTSHRFGCQSLCFQTGNQTQGKDRLCTYLRDWQMPCLVRLGFGQTPLISSLPESMFGVPEVWAGSFNLSSEPHMVWLKSLLTPLSSGLCSQSV